MSHHDRQPDPAAPAGRAPGYRELLRSNPEFRRLWLSDLVSFFGDWFNHVAVYAIVLRLSGSGQALAAVLIVRTLPAFLIAPVAGPLIDRFDRKRVMIATDVARVLGVGGLLWARAAESLPGLLACLTWMMVWTGIFLPAKNSVVPMLTDRRELPAANALAGGTWSMMLAVGAALGGVATAAFGEAASLTIDGVTFLVSALLLAGLPSLPPPRHEREGVAQSTSFAAGLRYVASTPVVAALISVKPMMALAAGGILVIPLFGDGVFPDQRGPLYIGLLYAARGVGAVIGSMALRTVVGDAPRTLRRMILVGYLTAGVGYALFGTAPSFAIAAAAMVLTAMGTASNWVFSGTLVQIYGHPAYHGRLFSLEFGLMTLVFSAMSWVAGTALDGGSLDPREVARASGAVLLLPLILWLTFLLVMRRRLRIAGRLARKPAPSTLERSP